MNLNTLILNFIDWLTSSFTSNTDLTAKREWCMMGIEDEDLNQNTINDFFDRTDLNATYKERYNERDIATKKQYAYTQVEINLVTGFHKSFAARHRTRLQVYRDDSVQKHYHTTSSVRMGYEKFLAERAKAEDKR